MPLATDERKIQAGNKATKRGFMRANVFRAPNHFGLEEKPIPSPGYGEAVIRVTLASICGTDVHIVRGGYPVAAGLTLGHEAVGVIHELGPGITGYEPGQRVLVGATTPCGQCEMCLEGRTSQCGGPLGGWRLGNTMDGVQAEFALIPFAQANLAPVPEALTDEDVLMLADTASTGFAAAENGGVRLGDVVAVFAQGPIGLCATLGAHLMGAAQILVVDADPHRLQVARQYGASGIILAEDDVVNEIRDFTDGRGVDVAIEALGAQDTFENALRVLRPGGTLSCVGLYSGHLHVPSEALAGGLGDYRIVTTLCPGGKERMRRLMRMVEGGRVNLAPLLTHVFRFDEIAEAYEMFSSRRDEIVKPAIRFP